MKKETVCAKKDMEATMKMMSTVFSCASAPNNNLIHRRELFTDHCISEDTGSKGQDNSS